MKVLALALTLAGLGLAPLAANAAPGVSFGAPAAYANNAGVNKQQAAQIALRAVGGGAITNVQYENDMRPFWQVEINQGRDQWEVNISARSGKVLSIIRQGEGY